MAVCLDIMLDLVGNHKDRVSHEVAQMWAMLLFELRHEKTNILHMRKTKTQISFAVTAKLISAFVFAT